METGSCRLVAWISALILGLCSLALLADERKSIPVISAPTPFFSFQDAQGQPDGYSVDLIRNILNHAGYDSDIRQQPFDQMLETLKQQPDTLAAAVVRTQAREDQYFWITPITANPIGLFIRRDRLEHYPIPVSLSAANNIAVVDGDYRHRLLQQAGVKDILPVDTWEHGIELVLTKQADGIFFSHAGLKIVCSQAQLNCQHIIPSYVDSVRYSYLVVPKHQANRKLATELTVAATQYKLSAKFSALKEAYHTAFDSNHLDATFDNGVVNFSKLSAPRLGDNLWAIGTPEKHFVTRDRKGRLSGFAVELLRELFRRGGIHSEILMAPRGRALIEARAQPNVLTFPLARTPEREAQFHWLVPIASNMHGLFGIGFEPIEDLSQLPQTTRIGVPKYDYRGDVLRDLGFTPVMVDSWSDGVQALYQAEVDLLFGSFAAVAIGCHQADLNCENVQLIHEYQRTTSYFALSKYGAQFDIAEALKFASQEYIQSPEFEAWAEQWITVFNDAGLGPVHFSDGVLRFWPQDED